MAYRTDRSMENMEGSSVPMMPMVRPSMTTPTSTQGTMGLSPRPTPFFDSLPSSSDAARRVAIDQDQGLSKSMGWITSNIILAPWEDGLENEIFNGQLIFSVPSDDDMVASREFTKTQVAALTLRHVNEFLRVGYQMASRFFKGSMPIKQEFSDDQVQMMGSLPVRNWHSLDFFKDKALGGDVDSMARQLVYLSEALILRRFNVYGWVDGQVPPDGRLKQVAVRRAGTMEDVENLWSPDMRPGDNLYFILRRIYNPRTEQWEQFAFLPWFGHDCPSIAERTYMDFTGHMTEGCAIYIGSLDRYTQKDGLRLHDLPQLIGIEKCTLPRVKIGPEPGCLRITAVGSKNRVPWLF